MKFIHPKGLWACVFFLCLSNHVMCGWEYGPKDVHTYKKRSLSGPISIPIFRVDRWVLGGTFCLNCTNAQSSIIVSRNIAVTKEQDSILRDAFANGDFRSGRGIKWHGSARK